MDGKRFYVWLEGGAVRAAWYVFAPDHEGATDCTDMSDEEFEAFIARLNAR